jgi:hypothetical protein
MSNRIGGDFDPQTIEAFRAAYASQLSTPEEQDVDQNTGLPTEIVSNTSPWIEHTGLWKYPSGKGPEDDLKMPFDPSDFISEAQEKVEDEELTEEDIDAILREVIEEGESIKEVVSGLDVEGEEDEEDIGLSEEEVDALINEILESES